MRRRENVHEKKIKEGHEQILEEHLGGPDKSGIGELKNMQGRQSEKKIKSTKQSKEEGQPKHDCGRELDASQSQKPWKYRQHQGSSEILALVC